MDDDDEYELCIEDVVVSNSPKTALNTTPTSHHLAYRPSSHRITIAEDQPATGVTTTARTSIDPIRSTTLPIKEKNKETMKNNKSPLFSERRRADIAQHQTRSLVSQFLCCADDADAAAAAEEAWVVLPAAPQVVIAGSNKKNNDGRKHNRQQDDEQKKRLTERVANKRGREETVDAPKQERKKAPQSIQEGKAKQSTFETVSSPQLKKTAVAHNLPTSTRVVNVPTRAGPAGAVLVPVSAVTWRGVPGTGTRGTHHIHTPSPLSEQCALFNNSF